MSNHNLMQLKRLTKTAREEMERTELRNKLNAADNEVMEAYKKISQVLRNKDVNFSFNVCHAGLLGVI